MQSVETPIYHFSKQKYWDSSTKSHTFHCCVLTKQPMRQLSFQHNKKISLKTDLTSFF